MGRNRVHEFIDDLTIDAPPDHTKRITVRMSVMRFYMLTKIVEKLNEPNTFGPGFSTSGFASDLLEEAIRDAYEYLGLNPKCHEYPDFDAFLTEFYDVAEVNAAKERIAATVERQAREALAKGVTASEA